jgi:hypothetical protein
VGRERLGYVQVVNRVEALASRYGFDVLIAVGAIESALEVALRDDSLRAPRTTLWFAVPAIALVVLPLLGRRRFPFAAPLSVWLVAAAVSVVDGRLVVFTVSAFVAGTVASFLLGNVGDAAQARVGAVVMLAATAMVVYTTLTTGRASTSSFPCCS